MIWKKNVECKVKAFLVCFISTFCFPTLHSPLPNFKLWGAFAQKNVVEFLTEEIFWKGLEKKMIMFESLLMVLEQFSFEKKYIVYHLSR